MTYERPAPSEKALDMQKRVEKFVQTRVIPREGDIVAEISEGDRWSPISVIEDLKKEAKSEGLWNMFYPDDEVGAGLTNLEYATIAESTGWSPWAPEVFNCNAPDTGNMEVIARYGSEEQKEKWLQPLLDGEIRSCFAMTEPDVASSDATNIQTSMVRDGDEWVINGRKWWTSGACDPRCKIMIVMGKTSPDDENRHRQQSMILVPMDTPGVEVIRPLPVFGYDDAPHGHAEINLKDVRVPLDNLILGEGRGFEIAQGRLGPGRIHHCMRLIGASERALALMCGRLASREAFGKPIVRQSIWAHRIAEARCKIDQARLLTMHAAQMMDTVGNRVARKEIGMIKIVAPNVACEVIDWAIQAYGGAGVSDVTPLAWMYAGARTLRLADGPDEVHRAQVAKLELRSLAEKFGMS